MISIRPMRRIGCVLAVLGLLASVACTKDDHQATPSATVGTAAPTTTTTNPYAIPSTIDADYVNRILASFDGLRGDVIRLAMRTKTIPPEAIDRYRSVYGKGDLLQLAIDLLQDDMRKGFSDYRNPPGNFRTTVDHFITVKPSCIFAEVQRDYLEISSPPVAPPSRMWVVLAPNPGDIDPFGYNPTPWYLPYDGYQPGKVAPPDPCSAK